MIRPACLAIAAACLCAAPASADDVSGVWSVGPEPWAIVDASAAFGAEDAYVFADVASGRGLDHDAMAAAVQIDLDRMRRDDALPRSARTSRVAQAYDSFVTVEGATGAYASRGFARSDAPASVQRAAKAPMIAPMMALAIVATLFPAR